MKTIKLLFAALTLSLTIASCQKNDKLTPSTEQTTTALNSNHDVQNNVMVPNIIVASIQTKASRIVSTGTFPNIKFTIIVDKVKVNYSSSKSYFSNLYVHYRAVGASTWSNGSPIVSDPLNDNYNTVHNLGIKAGVYECFVSTAQGTTYPSGSASAIGTYTLGLQ